MLDFRSVLEVCKYLSACDVLVSVEAVCSLWKEASNTRELWTDLCERDGYWEFCHYENRKKAYEIEATMYRMTVVKEDALTVFDCKSNQWVSKTLSRRLGKAVDMTVTLWKYSVVCTGGFRGNSVYLISLKGAVTELAELRTPRYRHGLIAIEDTAYAFGGLNQCALRSSECLHLQSPHSWADLPDMYATHHSFNPFAVKDSVYIWGGYTPRVEVFSLEKQVFTLVGVFQGSECRGEQCAVVNDDYFYLITPNQHMKGRTSDLKVEVQFHSGIEKVYSQAPPIFTSGSVFTLWQGRIYSINFASGQRTTRH